MPSKVHCLLTPARFLLLLLFASLSACLCFGEAAGVQHAPTPVREADAACAGCHAEIMRQYLHSPMANGSGVAMERLRTGQMQHAASGVHYEVTATDGSAQLTFSRTESPAGAAAGKLTDDAALKGQHRLEYFLGSGNLGTTYLYSEDGYLLESPVAFYSRLKTYDMAPGLGDSRTMPAALPMTPGCMRCHMSDVQAPDPGTRNRYTVAGLPFLHGGITCERCHGDATAHVRSGGRQGILNPVKLDPEARDSVCINCHLEGDASVERKGRSVLEYKPGRAH